MALEKVNERGNNLNKFTHRMNIKQCAKRGHLLGCTVPKQQYAIFAVNGTLTATQRQHQ